MITREQARLSVASVVCVRPEWLPSDDQIILVDEATIERPWGWVFFHSSKKWIETQDIHYAMAGNAPILVERASGRLLTLGTAKPVERYIEAYERTGDPHA